MTSTAAKRRADGARRLHATTYFNRLTQRLVTALTAPTRRGALYEVDLRLRPQGGKSPIATQWRGFLSYQAEEAETWERMALTRARAIAGDESLMAEATEAVAGGALGAARSGDHRARCPRNAQARSRRKKARTIPTI